MGIGKYLTNFGVIGSVFGAFAAAKQTHAMPSDWRRFLVWGVWAAGLVLAVVGVAKQEDDERHEEVQRELEKQLKSDAKAARRRH